ncbi:MAG: hypothetical protein IJX77_10315 [Ruminococcus sp.]|nr:hypothetical protein [Ruminococcus sp.]
MANKKKQPKNARIWSRKQEVNLVWKQTFGKDSTMKFDTVQKFIDSECIRLMVKYTPSRNNILAKAAVLGTKIGSGRIVILSPYGRYQYYGKLMVSSVTGSPFAKKGEKKVLTDRDLQYSTVKHHKAQRLWFEVMKKNHVEAILGGAARIAGGKVK